MDKSGANRCSERVRGFFRVGRGRVGAPIRALMTHFGLDLTETDAGYRPAFHHLSRIRSKARLVSLMSLGMGVPNSLHSEEASS